MATDPTEIPSNSMTERTEPHSHAINDTVVSANNRSNDVHSNSSSGINCETLRIHPTSDIFDPKKNYAGLINYFTGEIYIKESNWIRNNIPQRKGRHRNNYLHGRLFYWTYKRWRKRNTTFIGRGFSYLDNEWKYLSRTLNPIENDHQLNKFEEVLVQLIMDNLYINHRWLEMHPDDRIDCKMLDGMKRNKTYISLANPSNIHVNRKLHGTVKWLNDQNRRLGLIQCIGLDREFCIHGTEISNCRSRSEENVKFNVTQVSHKWKATNIAAT